MALLPENTVADKERLLSIDSNCRNTFKVKEEILLRLWIQHGIEMNCKKNHINCAAEEACSSKENVLPELTGIKHPHHRYWLAGPMWEGACRLGEDTRHRTPRRMTDLSSGMLTRPGPMASPDLMSLPDLLGMEDASVHTRLLDEAIQCLEANPFQEPHTPVPPYRLTTLPPYHHFRTYHLTTLPPFQETYPRTGKPRIFKWGRTRCNCNASLKIQRANSIWQCGWTTCAPGYD